MNVNRSLTVMAIAGALLAWFAAAATSTREEPPPILAPRPRVDPLGSDLAKEIARLHDRLRPDVTPRQPGRNLFAYRAAARGAATPIARPPQPALSEQAPTAAPALPLPPMDLVGIAEDDNPDGAVRTAIISAGGQLFLVKPGEAVTSRYRVARVAAEGVELLDAIDGSTRRLVLK